MLAVFATVDPLFQGLCIHAEENEYAYDEEAPGFFLIPADREDNNIRIFVVRSALKELRLES